MQIDTAKKSKTTPDKGKEKKLPKWWVKLSPEGQKDYIHEHPESKFAKQMKRSLKKGAVKDSPALRKKLRVSANKVAKSPDKVFGKKEKAKLSAESIKSKVGEKEYKKLSAEASAVAKSGKKKDYTKLAIKTLKIAGLLAIGAAVLATGGLPYVILGAHLMTSAKGAYTDFKTQINSGVDAMDAIGKSASKAISTGLRDPAMVQAAMLAADASGRRKATREAVKQARSEGVKSVPKPVAPKPKPKPDKPVAKTKAKP